MHPNSYIAWDLETSGLDGKKDCILEIGAMHVKDGDIVERKSWIIQNNIEISEFITGLTGIDKALIDREGGEPVLAIEEFVRFMGKEEHNLTHNGFMFDINFFVDYATRFGDLGLFEAVTFDMEPFKKHLLDSCLDTAFMYKSEKILRSVPHSGEAKTAYMRRVMTQRAYGKYNVGHCCDTLGIDRSQVKQHRALGDIELTHLIYQKLTGNHGSQRQEEGGTVQELQSASEGAGVKSVPEM